MQWLVESLVIAVLFFLSSCATNHGVQSSEIRSTIDAANVQLVLSETRTEIGMGSINDSKNNTLKAGCRRSSCHTIKSL